MNLLLTILLSLIGLISWTQDSTTNEYTKYDVPNGKHKLYWENGQLQEKFTLKDEGIIFSKKFNKNGQLVSKSRRKKTKRGKFMSKRLHIEYYNSGKVKWKRFINIHGCHDIKRRWKKEFDENGKRIKK